MIKTKSLSFICIVSLLTAPLAIVNASAASAVGTALTLTLTGGALSISAPATADLGTATANSAGSSISTQIGVIVVTDSRAAAAGSGWTATAISTALTPTAGPALAASLIAYSAGTISVTGTVTCTDNDPNNLIGVSPVVTATGITGSNTATWNPTLTVTIPGSYVAGVYTGAITHSVL